MVTFIKEILVKGEILNEDPELKYKEDSYVNINHISLVRPARNPALLKAFVGKEIVFILKKDFEELSTINIGNLSKV